MSEQRNLFLAVLISIAILIGYEFVFGKRQAPPPQQQAQQQVQKQVEVPKPLPEAPPPVKVTPAQMLEKALATPRVRIETPSLKGSIALQGGRLDDITLIKFKEDLKDNSKNITFLAPSGAEHPYFAEFGWVLNDINAKAKLPTAETVWQADGAVLTPDTPITLSWDNGEGLRFSRKFAVDKDYMFTVTQKVENVGGNTVPLIAYSLISRTGKPKTQGMYILHEGPLGFLDGSLKEVTYDDLGKEGTIAHKSTGGWIGITDKYWLAAIAPEQAAPVNARFLHHRVGSEDKYQVDFLDSARLVAPGAVMENTTRLFAGAKHVMMLDRYAEQLGISRFDLAIDFGWFYFLTKPFFYILQFFHAALGNFGLAILALTVLVKLALYPLANKSYRAMSRMKKLQPQMKELQERFSEDKVRLNQELMALYKREKVNPMAGCLPIFIQIPVFFALYKVLFVTIEMRHTPFYGWIKDLSAPDPTTMFNLFGLINWTPPDSLMIGIWPLLMGITMYLQQKLNPQPADPMQAKIMMALPFIFTYLLASFPAGLVIYWAWSNTLSILQQWVIMKSDNGK